jgi:hypothetical protein
VSAYPRRTVRIALLSEDPANEFLSCRFGWVNASYIYGLGIVSAHMRRALGTLTPYHQFEKALAQQHEKALAELE